MSIVPRSVQVDNDVHNPKSGSGETGEVPVQRRPKVVFFSTLRQFGYRVDSYEYCKHLRTHCDVTYFSLDFKLPKIELPGVEVVYQTRPRNRVARYLAVLTSLVRFVRAGSFDILFFEYFYGCSVVQMLVGPTRCILDVRTGGVSEVEGRNLFYNLCIRIEHVAFRNVTVISEGLRDHLCLSKVRSHILPLGANGEYMRMQEKDFSQLRLLYVGGIVEGRNLDRMIRGVVSFLEKAPKNVGGTLHIVGSGPAETLQSLRKIVDGYNAGRRVRFHGFVPHEELTRFFMECNVGINYIPITPYFDHQPPTKLFEYGMAGMAILSTSTTENSRYVSTDCGVLTGDGIGDVEEGLQILWRRRRDFSSTDIKTRFSEYTWEKIVHGNLLPYLRSLSQKNH